ncbi:MAG: T9SS type A sorting domain-containing protein [Flavobacterium sp.]
MTKKILLSLLFTTALTFGQTTFLVENFEYPAGDLLIDNGWFAHSASGTNSVAVSTSGLSWSGYVASGIGNAALVTNTGEDVNRPFSTYPTEGSIYASFLMRVNAPFAAAGSGFFFHLGYYSNTSTPVFTALNTAFRARTFVLQGTDPDTQFKLGLSFNTNDATGSTDDLTIGQTYLVVIKYQFIEGAGNDEVSLYFFPEGANIETEPATPDLGPFIGTAADAPVLQAVVLRQYNASQDVTVDGIVVRDSWNLLDPDLSIENVNLSDISMYPNPVDNNGIVNLAGEMHGPKLIEVFDYTGKKISEINTSQDYFSVNGISSGVYIVKISSNSTSTTSKLIVK